MKAFRYILWALVVALGGFLAWSTINWTIDRENGVVSNVASIGGPFSAVNAKTEQPITQEALKGRPHVIFFGFTYCPDVCPTTLYEAGQWLEEIGPAGDKLKAWFVTVDPERDTPETLAQYLSAFDKRIGGITGSREQIDDMARKWRVFQQKVPTEDGDYTMNHTASVFLMNADGSFFGTIAFGENNETAIAKLQRLVEANS